MQDLNLPSGTEEIDLDGRYIIPGLINAHGHVGMADGLRTGPEIHSRDNVIAQLQLSARYGITTVVSLGDEPRHTFEVRNQENPAERGMARIYLSGPVLNPVQPGEAAAAVLAALENDPDWNKIRVDDQLGRQEKMSPETYQIVIEESHRHEIPLAAHIVTLEDAKGIVRSGGDLVAHSIRDQPVDNELISLMLDRDICITPTLTREISVYIYRERPDFFDDPYFLRDADLAVLEELQLPEVQQRYTGEAPDYYKEALPLAIENMMTLHRAGIRVAMGTDSGPPARFQGYFEQLEMEMMQEAGFTPAEVLLSATRNAAECLQIDDQVSGTLTEGSVADFIILPSNPLEDIRNLRSLEAVYIGGKEAYRVE